MLFKKSGPFVKWTLFKPWASVKNSFNFNLLSVEWLSLPVSGFGWNLKGKWFFSCCHLWESLLQLVHLWNIPFTQIWYMPQYRASRQLDIYWWCYNSSPVCDVQCELCHKCKCYQSGCGLQKKGQLNTNVPIPCLIRIQRQTVIQIPIPIANI